MSDRYTQHLRAQLAPVSVTGRWTPGRKSMVVELIRRGALTVEQACATYGITAEEIEAWRGRHSAFGRLGLCVTKLQMVGRV